jgi:AAHS family 4-hydroxybenzoate transporter-like MFS transporter
MGHTIDESSAFEDTMSTSSRGTIGELFGVEFRRDTTLLWIAFFSCLLAIYLGFNWLPSVISGAGLSNLSSTSVGVFNLGGVAGALAGGFLITRFGSRPTMLAMAAGGALGSLALSRMQLNPHIPVVSLLAALAFTGGLINGLQTTLYALAGYVYPTNIRATGVGAATSIGRTGAVLSGYAGPWALAHNGSSSFFVLMGTAVTVTLLALAGVRRHVE